MKSMKIMPRSGLPPAKKGKLTMNANHLTGGRAPEVCTRETKVMQTPPNTVRQGLGQTTQIKK